MNEMAIVPDLTPKLKLPSGVHYSNRQTCVSYCLAVTIMPEVSMAMQSLVSNTQRDLPETLCALLLGLLQSSL